MYDINSISSTYQNSNYGYPFQFNPMMTRCCRKSYLRIFNTLKNGPKIDFYINEMLMTSNLGYGEFSKFMKLMPGSYKVTARASGSHNGHLYESNITIEPNLVYTGALTGDAYEIGEISLYMIPEEKERYNMGNMSALKIINLVINSPNFNLTTDDGATLFEDVNYGDISNNVAIPSGTYTLNLIDKDKEQGILRAPNVDFVPKMVYTLYIIGEYEDKPKIELLIPNEGLNNLDLC